jgi:hypothetical protein
VKAASKARDIRLLDIYGYRNDPDGALDSAFRALMFAAKTVPTDDDGSVPFGADPDVIIRALADLLSFSFLRRGAPTLSSPRVPRRLSRLSNSQIFAMGEPSSRRANVRARLLKFGNQEIERKGRK